MPPALRRLHPSPAGPTTPAEAYRGERPVAPPRPPGPRPWVGLCMIASLDGAVAVDGTSGALGNANDREVLLTLRDLADVVLVGAGTARGEGYGPPRTPGLRIGVVTNSGHVDLDRAPVHLRLRVRGRTAGGRRRRVGGRRAARRAGPRRPGAGTDRAHLDHPRGAVRAGRGRSDAQRRADRRRPRRRAQPDDLAAHRGQRQRPHRSPGARRRSGVRAGAPAGRRRELHVRPLGAQPDADRPGRVRRRAGCRACSAARARSGSRRRRRSSCRPMRSAGMRPRRAGAAGRARRARSCSS